MVFGTCWHSIGGLDNYILTTHPEDLASRAAMELRSLLVPKWEAANGRPYDRRQLVYESRLLARVLKRKVSVEEATQLVHTSRVHLAQKRGTPVPTEAPYIAPPVDLKSSLLRHPQSSSSSPAAAAAAAAAAATEAATGAAEEGAPVASEGTVSPPTSSSSL